ncbi:MAG: hypothetical protein IIY21_06015 [Clostridiales bacterium]|nr:hypothetical protein [Clostridiales bacterium]
MSIKANYQKAKTLLEPNTPGIFWFTYQPWESTKKVSAKICTYREFLSSVKARMDTGEFPKTFEYGWRDGNETDATLYTDFLIDIESKRTGLRMGFDAIESYNVNTKKRKYVRPTKGNSRFWTDYQF